MKRGVAQVAVAAVEMEPDRPATVAQAETLVLAVGVAAHRQTEPTPARVVMERMESSSS